MVDNQMVVTQSAQETQKLGEEIGRDLRAGLPAKRRVVALFGELGSGKTTFIQGFAKGLGVKSRILSPTFIFVRQYPLSKKAIFYHVDLYRVNNLTEAKGLGLEEILADSQAIVAIEWSEKVQKILPQKRLDVHFEYLENNQRKVLVKQL